jgi:outer membrane protein assembly factor BamB
MKITGLLGGLLALSLGACGGGGSGPGGAPSLNSLAPAVMTVSPGQISVSASVSDITAPSAVILVGVANDFSGTLFVRAPATSNGIGAVEAPGGSANLGSYSANAAVNIAFKNPWQLAPGTYADTVTVSACVDASCSTPVGNSPQVVRVQYLVTPSTLTATPAIASLAPAAAVAGDAGFTLTVLGRDFSPQASVLWNGSARPTRFVSTTQLQAQIAAGDIAAAGRNAVTVSNQASGGGNSTGVGFPVTVDTLVLGQISPTTVTAGGPGFTLTALGSGFLSSSVLQWNGSGLVTTVVSPTEITAQVPAADVAATGSAQITVANTSGGAAPSAPLTLAIATASIDAVAYRMNAAQTASVAFTDFGLPTGSLWRVNLSGTPSYALIAGGRIFVAQTTPGGMQVVALDAASGALAWGPLNAGVSANLAYDQESLYVQVDNGSGTGTLLSVAPATGQVQWSASLQDNLGDSSFTAPPVAANGLVFVEGDDSSNGNGSTMYAVRQADGTVAWTFAFGGTGDFAPAASADGLYVGGLCGIFDLRPATGEVVWNGPQGGCALGAAPSVAGGIVYGYDYFANASGSGASAQLDAETGALQSSFLAATPPAVDGRNVCFLQGGALSCPAAAGGAAPWQFTGDGRLSTAPILVNSYAFVGSAGGMLYAVNLATGLADWQAQLGAPIAAHPAGYPNSVNAGLTAGDGLLLVPAGNTLSAFALTAGP